MAIICKNCNQQYQGKFCNNCGQPADTHEINFHFLWHDIQHGLFHFDNGIFYTIKELFSRPGSSIKEFINGKRVRHFKPFSLVVILATLYAFLYHLSHIEMPQSIKVSGDVSFAVRAAKINEWIGSHYALAALATLPFYAVGTFIAFKKQGYNFAEHLTINAFLSGQKLVLRIAFLPLIYAFSSTSVYSTVTTIIPLVEFVLMFWCFSGVFNKLSKLKTFLLILLSYLIYILALGMVIGIIGGIIYFWK